MSRHRPDLIVCMRLAGTTDALLCEKCDGKCPLCDSHVHPAVKAKLCSECAPGTAQRCVICAAPAAGPAYYCQECVLLERDRDGCPNVINIGTLRVDKYYAKRHKKDSDAGRSIGQRGYLD